MSQQSEEEFASPIEADEELFLEDEKELLLKGKDEVNKLQAALQKIKELEEQLKGYRQKEIGLDNKVKELENQLHAYQQQV